MKPFLASALAAAVLVAGAAPAAGAWSSVTDRNVAWILDALGFEEPTDERVTIETYAGSSAASMADAVRVAAERAGDVELAALAAGATENEHPYGVGDVWIIEYGDGTCGWFHHTILSGSPVPRSDLLPQTRTYAGALGSGYSDHVGAGHYQGLVIDWTTKLSTGGAYVGGEIEFAGQSDFYCFSTFWWYYYAPYIDGFARVLPEESA